MSFGAADRFGAADSTFGALAPATGPMFGYGTFGGGTFGSPSVWTPGDVWPSDTTGGAQSPYWGGYIRLWIRAGLAPGKPFHVGTHANAFLDAGNVMGGAEAVPAFVDPDADRLWVDLTCDTLDCEIAGGASGSQGIFSKADAATLVVTLRDPDGKYDPLNNQSPYAYEGRSRLVPGTPVDAFAEIVDGPTGDVTRHWLFTGTADSWAEDWTPSRTKREAKLVATDTTKQWVRYDQPEQAPAGAGDTTQQRVQRLVDYFGWPGTVEHAASSTVTLQATTLAQNGWELLNRTLDDELGFVHFTREGTLRWLNRDAWFTLSEPVIELGCPHVTPATDNRYDVLTDASPSALDLQMRNAVYAARTGGTTQTAVSTASQAEYGVYDYKRTDLGLADDPQTAAWASKVLELYAYPQVTLDNVTVVPAIHERSWEVWEKTFSLAFVTAIVRIVWAPPDLPENKVEASSRVVGFKQSITFRSWEIELQLVAVHPIAFAGQVFTFGPHDQDQLDAGFVLGLT